MEIDFCNRLEIVHFRWLGGTTGLEGDACSNFVQPNSVRVISDGDEQASDPPSLDPCTGWLSQVGSREKNRTPLTVP